MMIRYDSINWSAAHTCTPTRAYMYKIINAVSRHAEMKKERMPFRNQYLAELTPTVRDTEERRLLSPAACAWAGEAGLRPWESQMMFAASLRWVVGGGKQDMRAARGARARRVPVQGWLGAPVG
jgi:hypothetical protein